MAFTKVVGPGIHTLSNILSHNINSSGIITATQFDGPFSNVVVGGATTLTVDGINISAGILTAKTLDLNGNGDISGNLVVDGDLTVNGTTTTLDTNLIGVDRIEVLTAGTNVAVAVTHNGTGDLVRLYDGTSQKVTVDDEGQVGIGTVTPLSALDVRGTTHALGNGGAALVWGNTTSLGTLTYSGSNARITASNDLQIHSTKLRVGGGTTENADGAFDDLIVGTHSGNRGISILSGSSNQGALGFAKLGALADGYVAYNHNSTATDSSMVIKSSGKIQFNPGSSEKFTITDTGTVQFKGSATSDNNKMQIVVNNTVNKILGSSNSTTNKSFSFHSSNRDVDEKLRITDTGLLLVGRTSGTYKFDVQHGAADIIRMNNSGETTHGDVDAKLVAGGTYYQNLKLVGSSIIFNTYDGSSETTKWKIDSNGHLLPNTIGAVNIGSATAEIGNVYIADDKQLTLGNDNNLYIKHSNGHANNFIVSSVGDIEHHMALSKKIIKGFNNSGTPYVNLYQGDNNIRLTTTATGITVTGEVAASQDYPNFRPTLDLNFAKVKKLDPRISYQRSGAASFVNEFGKIVLVGPDAPRFDHDPITRESKGLLIEESRTNIVYNAVSASNGTFTKNVFNSLTGNNDAVKMVKNSSSVNQSHINYQISGNGSTTSFVASVFVQKTNHSRYFLQMVSSNVSDNFYVYYNVDNGTTSATDFGNPNNNITSTRSIKSYGDNWYRLIVRVQGFAQNTFNSFRVGVGEPSSGAQGYQNTDDELIAYGAQIEVGDFVTSYIPAYETATSRGVDTVMIDGENFTEFYNPVESTILVDYTHDFVTSSQLGTNQRVYRFRAVGGSDTRIDYVSNSDYNPYVAKDGTAVASISDGVATVFGGGANKTAVRVKENSFATCQNGTLGTEDTSGAWNPTNAITEVSFGGNGSGGNALNGHIQRFMYYSVGLPSSQLVTLTS